MAVTYKLAGIGTILAFFVIALLTTLAIELVVALPFRLGRSGVRAVGLVNLLTNPLFNLALLVSVYTVGLGESFSSRRWGWLLPWIPLLLEIIVVVVEWRLLVWVMKGTSGRSPKLLIFAIVANVVSALSPFLFAYGFFEVAYRLGW